MHKVIIVVHGIGEQKQFETLFDFSDGFHWSTRNIIKDYGEKKKNELVELTGDNPRDPYISKAVLWAVENLRKNNQPLNSTSLVNEINNRLSTTIQNTPQKLQAGQLIAANKAASLLKVAQDLEELLKLNYTFKLFPRGLGIEKDGFAEVSHTNRSLHLYELWWAPEVKNKPKLLGILIWLSKTILTAKSKGRFLLYLPLALLGIVVDMAAIIIYFIFPSSRKYIKSFLIDSFGDVNVYIADEVERKRIQDCLERKINDLTVDAEAGEIWLVGHSLGSVISFDVLKKFIDSNVKTKVTRFYSVGSPLDKINYFWGDNYGSGVIDLLQNNGIEWRNYYAPIDIVSDYLRSFGKLKEQEEFFNSLSLFQAHTTYWQNNFMMEDIVRDVYSNDVVFHETPYEKLKRKRENKKDIKENRAVIVLASVFWLALGVVVLWGGIFLIRLFLSESIKFVISLIK